MPDDPRPIYGAEIPFASFCGVQALDADERGTRLRVDLEPQHLNNLGIAHGGMIATILDVAMGTAARTTIGRPVMTLAMNVVFLSPGREALLANGRVLKAGRSILFCEADVTTLDGELVARATGTLKPAGKAPESEPAR